MSRINGRFAGQGQEHELQRSVKEPVYIWKRELVVPSALAKPAGSVSGLAERMGIDSAATRSETPLRIPKWVP
ncbi:hypothetical protein GLX27_002851 [Malassezia furfur]|uniref:Uncharacterized protein n=1 Tax=Malassezia furfur TaxID=55194 RepID=A0ABY8EV80_MALFU|nr:hypothetical protein GLX27_002851 [Malassezia furfur]